MMRKFVSASLATALVFGSVSPAFAQSHLFAADQAPLGVNATLNFRVPLGAAPARHKKASYGLTFGYNHRLDGMTDDGRIATHQTKLADFRFTGGLKLWKAEVASYDLANLDKDPRLNMGPDDGKDSTTWIIIGLVVAGVAVCVAAECIGGYDDDDDDNGSDGGSGSGPY